MENIEEDEDEGELAEKIKATQQTLITVLTAKWLASPGLMFSSMKEQIILRPCISADTDDIDLLYEETGGLQDGSKCEGTSKLLEFHTSLRSTLFVARKVSTGQLVGIGGIDWSALTVKAGLLTNLLVSTSVRRQGIGRMLVQHRESLLRTILCTEVHAMVKKTNKASRDLFAQLGYSVIFDGDQWNRRPFIDCPELNCNMLDECILVCKAL